MNTGPYSAVVEGEWTEMRMRGHREQCCDCGLIHRIDYRILTKGKRRELQFRCWRDDKATGKIRRRAGIVVLKA